VEVVIVAKAMELQRVSCNQCCPSTNAHQHLDQLALSVVYVFRTYTLVWTPTQLSQRARTREVAAGESDNASKGKEGRVKKRLDK
jgi:hypothetical protein